MADLACFVIMPFRDEFDAVYEVVQKAVAHAIPGEQIDCYCLKEVQAAGRITDDIIDSVNKATLCIADVTGSNPNVMWETGYAMAKDKPTILIAQNLGGLPFDLKVHRVLPYALECPSGLHDSLGEAVRQTLARYEVEPQHTTWHPQDSGVQLIAVTGTMSADQARVKRRVATLLHPYLDTPTMWCCGSNGTVDDIAIEYLVAGKQRVMAVGYHRYDFSETVHRMVQAGRVGFIDASTESVPSALVGPSARDVFFCAKADLVILIWDGASAGIRELIQYFQSNGKNVLIGFI